jgi:hypothetical protein
MSWWANVAASTACFVAAHSDKDNEALRKDVKQLRKMIERLLDEAKA